MNAQAAQWVDPTGPRWPGWSPTSWLALLGAARHRADSADVTEPPTSRPAAFAPIAERSVRVATATAVLDGSLALPPRSRAVIVVLDASGVASYAPGNRMVAAAMSAAGYAALSVTLFGAGERLEDCERTSLGVDLSACSRRTLGILRWVASHPGLASLPLGLFAAGAGAAAALAACADGTVPVRGVVCRGGRPELAGAHLPRVRTPTLFLVGENDRAMLATSRSAAATIGHGSVVSLVPGARSLVADEHAIEPVVRATVDWFAGVLPRPAVPS